MPTSLRARWIIPVDAPPLENGVVEISDGRIVAVHNRDAPRAADLGNVALIPGLVNAHVHLEFSDLAEPVQPATPFTAWIRALVAHRRAAPPTDGLIRRGLEESTSSGVTTLGEIATSDDALPAFRAAGGHGIVFREILALQPHRADEQIAIAQRHLQSVSQGSEARVIAGISPHAPYSVHPDLYQRLVALAATHKAPLAIHLAETRAELELLEHGTGDFVAMLQSFGVWSDGLIPRGSRPMDYLRPLADAPRALVIHGNYLAEDELDFLARHPQLALVYCPRTHHYFQHPPHPWRRLLERGGAVALGTDGRGSNPDLSLWRELQFLRRTTPDVPPATLLGLGTLRGARALGLEKELGSLTPGKAADLAAIAFPNDSAADPYACLLQGGTHPVAAWRSGVPVAPLAGNSANA